MNESSVSTPLLTKLRERLPQAIVFKHADVGMKGLPDASVTWLGRTLWLEFKLHQPSRHGQWIGPQEALQRFQKDAPVQAETCKRLGQNCLYVIWRKKIKEVWICSPNGSFSLKVPGSTEGVAAWIEDYLRSH